MLGKTTKNTIADSIVMNDTNYTQPSEISELFSKHFIGVGHDLASQIPPTYGPLDNIQRKLQELIKFQ